ncbi:MAG: hypothetical protein IKN24_00715 [Lachnospiraceae bacterium]|nr:hypothetical protein [Lachnospiraceae bacterium]
MKKQNITRRLALFLLITATAATLAACKFGSASGFFSRGEKEAGQEELVCYYGCPNSKRVKRLKVKSRVTTE